VVFIINRLSLGVTVMVSLVDSRGSYSRSFDVPNDAEWCIRSQRVSFERRGDVYWMYFTELDEFKCGDNRLNHQVEKIVSVAKFNQLITQYIFKGFTLD
jgi:hypothetical protein